MDFLSFYWRDVLDIALVTLLLYRILLLIRGTRLFRLPCPKAGVS